METLGAFLDDVTSREPGREAVAYAPSASVTARMSRGELRAGSRVAAKKLVGLGVGKGTRVGFLCPNRLDWLPIAFGALRIGAVLVPFSTLWKRDEIAYALAHGDVQVLVMVPTFLRHDYLAALGEIVPELAPSTPGVLRSIAAPALRRVVLLGGDAPGTQRWEDLPTAVDEAFLDALEARVSPTDLATIFFTSGTTAKAKAVVHAHGALTISGRRIAECLGTTPGDAWWGHMPLFWSGGFIIGALETLAGGGRIVLQEQVDPGSALALLEAEGCTIMAGWHQAGPLLEHPDWGKRTVKLRKGSNHPLADRLMGPDHVTVGMYGMSETATCVACARWDDPPAVRRETFGRPLAGMEIRIVDPDTGALAAPGEPGEIFVKGPTLMEGYYRVQRSETFDRDGFFKTGDLGFLDATGCLHFATRLKDVIKTAGVNVAAVEVEETLAKHPGVKAAHVVGVPDPVRGENVAAFVVLEDGATTGPEALQAFCRENLASYKVPRHVFVIAEAEVPRTGTGKIEKPTLKKLAQARLA
ncbi:MAG TPA: AMP-binding protein [Candidatus Eisenbacteria bacterium]|nr:AMP-binding protein [Candidatus Eisenbacteria bacterium]